MSDRSAGDTLFTFLLGAAIGAAAGVLLAPRPGSETWEKISDWLKENREKGKDLLDSTKKNISHQKEAVAAAYEAGKKAYKDTQTN